MSLEGSYKSGREGLAIPLDYPINIPHLYTFLWRVARRNVYTPVAMGGAEIRYGHRTLPKTAKAPETWLDVIMYKSGTEEEELEYRSFEISTTDHLGPNVVLSVEESTVDNKKGVPHFGGQFVVGHNVARAKSCIDIHRRVVSLLSGH